MSYGVVISAQELLNNLKEWRWTNPNDVALESGSTSISDGTDYVMICKDAVLNDSVYQKYKSAVQYREILEHTSYELGLSYLEYVRTSKEVSQSLRKIGRLENGSPFVYNFKGFGKLSPTHIRYAKVYLDLISLFGNLDGFRIAEIGVGFGGQALHILSNNLKTHYSLYDLEWPGKLALKNLGNVDSEFLDRTVIGKWNEPQEFDLIISNYAFSELSRDIQDIYITNLLGNSKRGYMIYNHIQEENSDSLAALDILDLIPGAELIQEIPLTHSENVLIVWGHNKETMSKDLFPNYVVGFD